MLIKPFVLSDIDVRLLASIPNLMLVIIQRYFSVGAISSFGELV